MSSNFIFGSRLFFGLLCHAVVGFLFAWTPLWEDAFGMNEVLSKGRGLILSRAIIIFLALSLTWGLAWIQADAMSWAKTLGWVWVLTCGVGLALGLVTGGGITFTVIWVFVVFIVWVGAWCLVGARNQLFLSFSESHTVLILAGIGIFGLVLGALWRFLSLQNP